jgi:hypothetical protein
VTTKPPYGTRKIAAGLGKANAYPPPENKNQLNVPPMELLEMDGRTGLKTAKRFE